MFSMYACYWIMLFENIYYLVKYIVYHDLADLIWYIVTALLLSLGLLGLGCYTFKNIIHAFLHSSSVIWIMSISVVFGNAFLINRYPKC